MGPLDFTFHLVAFAAPAFFVALAVTFGARFVGATALSRRWWAQAAINFTAGLVALVAGLWHFGVDGKMATYAALVAAVAVSQWICARGWK